MKEYLTGIFSFSLTIACIIISFFIILEVLEWKWLRKSSWTHRFNALGLSPAAFPPLFSGVIFGLLYGAGLIVSSLKNAQVRTMETLAILLFLSIFHSAFEDTLLFIAVGANFFIITIPRVILACAGLLISKYVRFRK